MRVIEAVRSIEVPEGVEVTVGGRIVTVTGEKGTLTRDFSHAPVSILLEGNLVKVQTKWPRKKEAALVGTVSSHIKNMIAGVTKGFTYKLKIVFSQSLVSPRISGQRDGPTMCSGTGTPVASIRVAATETLLAFSLTTRGFRPLG